MIFLLIGRGVEGCGVTKFSIELDKYLTKRNIDHQTYAFNDKKWTRRKSHDMDCIQQLSLEDDAEFNRFLSLMQEKATTVVINSLPSESHSELFQERFNKLLTLNKKYILFQHDHARMSIQRNACLDEAIRASDICFTHSRNNYFAKYVEENFNASNLESFFSDVEQKHIEVLPFQPAFDFDECRKQYWKDIEEQDPKHHKWIGRTTFWKGFELMFDWHESALRPNNCLTTFEGIETGIVYPEFIIRKPHNNFCKGFTEATQRIFEGKGLTQDYIDQYNWHGPKKIAEHDLSAHYGDTALVFGIYNNQELMDRLSRCGFGYQLTMLDPNNIERSVEYTHCEVVASGAIPVFRKKFGQACTHRSIGKPLYECDNSGTIWLDEENFDECIQQVKMLEGDSVLRNEWREMAYEFYKDHQDSDNVFKLIVEKFV